MKLSIAQAILGALIVLAAVCITVWMIFGIPSLLTMPVPDQDGVMRITRVFPEHETLITAARYASGLLLGLGVAVLFTGASWKRESSKKKTVIMIIAGAMITAVSVFIMRWGYPIVFNVPMPPGSNLTGAVNISPGLPMVLAVFLTVMTALLGLAVLGTGIAQYIKARR